MDEIDAELEQPDAESGPIAIMAVAPRLAVVDEEGLRQAVGAKRPFQAVLDGLTRLIGAGIET